MPIDRCPHTFQELAQQVLPKDMERMRAGLAAPVRMQMFAEGKAKVLRHMRRTQDFSGCYCQVERGEPFYVGISLKVATRLNSTSAGRPTSTPRSHMR